MVVCLTEYESKINNIECEHINVKTSVYII